VLVTNTHDERRGDRRGHGLYSNALKALEDTDWAMLQHAYGPARDTPPFLLQLLHDVPEEQAEALGMLEMSVLHQGSLYSATAPAARFIAVILPHRNTLAEHESFYPWDDRARPLRAALIEFRMVAEAAAYTELPGIEGCNEQGVTEACQAVRPALYDAIGPRAPGHTRGGPGSGHHPLASP
jgi:hypothetical protein